MQKIQEKFLKKNFFDIITINNVFNHSSKPLLFLREIKKILNKKPKHPSITKPKKNRSCIKTKKDKVNIIITESKPTIVIILSFFTSRKI
jgi:2-polyprenyl-3-methyl-5-hydroxy-6-metoxy-1,4-benzoquinol methylase